MFKPYEFYAKEKKLNKIQPELIRQEWSKLESRDQLRYIKQAESEYDKFLEGNSKTQISIQPFGYYLNKTELQILFESYGLPEKLPSNSKNFLIHNLKNEAFQKKESTADYEKLLEEVKKQGEEKWSSMSAENKGRLLQEYYQATIKYNEEYFNFARNLDAKRVRDYMILLNPSLKSQKISITNKPVKDLRHKFSPFEVYWEKNKDNFSEYTSLFVAKGKAKNSYLNLSEKKKLKLIKIAEKKFDSYKFEEHLETRPVFSSIISRQELKLLLDSYGMPEPVAANVTGYFFKAHIGEFKENHMKNVMNLWSSMNEEEKAKVGIEHADKINAYKTLNQKFLENLPLSRMDDFEYYDQNYVKKNKSGKANVSKSVELIDTASGLSDNETDLESINRSATNHSQINGDTEMHIVDSFVANNAHNPENGFSLFVNEELESITEKNLNKDKSTQLLIRISRKWLSLNETEKQDFDDKFKSAKKALKKLIKNFVKEHAELNLNVDDIKTKIKDSSAEKCRHIEVIFEDDTTETLYLFSKNSLKLINSDVNSVQVKKEKKNKNKDDLPDETPTKKIKLENCISEANISIERSVNNQSKKKI